MLGYAEVMVITYNGKKNGEHFLRMQKLYEKDIRELLALDGAERDAFVQRTLAVENE